MGCCIAGAETDDAGFVESARGRDAAGGITGGAATVAGGGTAGAGVTDGWDGGVPATAGSWGGVAEATERVMGFPVVRLFIPEMTCL